MNLEYAVLMSVYHKEKPQYLRESIESILNQTIKPSQIIIVKDGPLTKELESVLKDMTFNNSTFKLVELEKNIGLGLALNAGIKNCDYELIARMDSDDISHPSRMEQQLNRINKDPNIDIVGTLTAEFHQDINNVLSYRKVPEKNKDIIEFSKRRSPFNHATVMYKKSVLDKVEGYRDILRNEDYDLFVRMINNGCYSENIQEPLYYVRLDEDNHLRRKTWINCKNYIKVVFSFWKKGHSSFGDLFYVAVTQMGIYLSPTWLLKIVSNKFLREQKK